MKRSSIILTLAAILLSGSAVLANEPGSGALKPVSITDFVSASGSDHTSIEAFDHLIQRLEKKNTSSERDFVRFIFAKTHSQILKHYRNEAEFHELFKNGAYNCLTGTILYSLIFNHFGIRHQVIETNYHIFMIVNTVQGDVLLEATDPIKGFVYDQKEIEDRIQLYKEDGYAFQRDGKAAYQFKFNLYNTVSQPELLGLLYFNLSVASYNKQNLHTAIDYLAKSSAFYNSIRIDEFSAILLHAVSQSNLDEQAKLQQVTQLRSIRNKLQQTVAGM